MTVSKGEAYGNVRNRFGGGPEFDKLPFEHVSRPLGLCSFPWLMYCRYRHQHCSQFSLIFPVYNILLQYD